MTGPTRILDGSRKAVDFYQIFYSDELFEKILEFTNLNAKRKREADPNSHRGVWYDVTLDEIKAFYGISLLTEVMKFDREELYWSNNDEYWLIGSKFGEVMPRNRYFQIKRYLHFSDDTQVNNKDKLHKVRFILDHMRNKFMSEYKPHKEVTVDESMIPFKGRLGMKQYMKDKPIKFGIKMWVLADSVSSYCYNFEVYVGKKDTAINKIFGLSSKVVIELCKSLEMKGHVVFTDNFYTSLQLADYLYSRDTYLCGTMRTNRKYYPKQLVLAKREANRLPRGSFDWLMCDFCLASYWKDNRIVYYLSTYHDPEDQTLSTKRRTKDGTQLELSSTPTQAAYATYMSGVDRFDQMTRINRQRKSIRWYRKIELRLRECALYNAFIIEGTCLDHTPAHKRKRDLLSFRMEVAHALIGNFRSKRPFKRPRSASNDEERLDERNHWPTGSGSEDKLCVVCLKRHNNYKASHPGVSVKNNPNKRTKTTMACEKCKVALCCKSDTTCYRDYHTKVYYWQ